MTTWFESHISKIKQATPNARRFWLRLDDGQPDFDFRAGQFVTFDLPIHERRQKRWRSYSIASAPEKGSSRELEFCISKMENGVGSGWLFDQKVGTPIRFKGPDGAFFLPEKIEKDLVFIATGTGIAPFRSMILDLKNRKIEHRKLHLIFGTRRESDILYRSEFEKIAAEDPLFSFDVALSRAPAWPKWRGHLHQIYFEKYPTAPAETRFLLCGWSAMIDEAVENLIVKMGCDRTQIQYELYG